MCFCRHPHPTPYDNIKMHMLLVARQVAAAYRDAERARLSDGLGKGAAISPLQSLARGSAGAEVAGLLVALQVTF